MMLSRNFGSPANPTIVLPSDSGASSVVALNTQKSFESDPVQKIASTPSNSKPVEPAAKTADAIEPVLASTKKATRGHREAEPRVRQAVRVEESTPLVTEEDKVAIEAAAWSELVASIEVPSGDAVVPDESASGNPTTVASASPPIVIIEESVDKSTGAFKATEVGASNVLIGG